MVSRRRSHPDRHLCVTRHQQCGGWRCGRLHGGGGQRRQHPIQQRQLHGEPLPTVTVNSQTICVGDSATLTATSSAATPAYLWSPGGETTASITVSSASTTIYSVTVTDGTTTCTAGGSGTVTVQESIQRALAITHVGADVILSWPQTCTTYVLEETLELGAPATWTPVTASITAVGADYQITVPGGAGNKFYRLKKQP